MECILNPGVPCDNLINYAYVMWFAFGIFLMIMEFIVPGVFIVFFGVGAIIAGGLHYLFNFGLVMQLTTWILSSFVIILFGAKFLKDLFPSEQSYEPTMIENDFGRLVRVIKTIHQGKKGGRITFQGTDWDAISDDTEILSGTYAKVIERKNLTYFVHSATQNEIDSYLNSIKKEEED